MKRDKLGFCGEFSTYALALLSSGENPVKNAILLHCNSKSGCEEVNHTFILIPPSDQTFTLKSISEEEKRKIKQSEDSVDTRIIDLMHDGEILGELMNSELSLREVVKKGYTIYDPFFDCVVMDDQKGNENNKKLKEFEEVMNSWFCSDKDKDFRDNANVTFYAPHLSGLVLGALAVVKQIEPLFNEK